MAQRRKQAYDIPVEVSTEYVIPAQAGIQKHDNMVLLDSVRHP